MKKAVILLIEDNPTTSKMIRSALEREDWKIIETRTGEQALTEIGCAPFDLIIQDLTLPDISGEELNKKIRELPDSGNTPIIALTGFLARLESLNAHLSISTVLIKPVDTAHLVDVVRTYLTFPHFEQQGEVRKNVLIADDNKGQLELLKLQLTRSGFTVTTAENGEEAFKLAQEDPPDAIVSDILMPKMDGFDLCLKVRSDPILHQIPIIFLTSHYVEEADRELAKLMGANAYLTRTPDPTLLLAKLYECFNEISHRSFTVPPDAETVKKEHKQRLIRQLEQQIIQIATLSQKCALQAAQLSFLNELADALNTEQSINTILRNVISSCLDAAGINKGALFRKNGDDDTPTLPIVIGYSDREHAKLEHFFNHPEIFSQIMQTKSPLYVPSEFLSSGVNQHLLSQANVNSAIIIPVFAKGECLGILFFGSDTIDLSSKNHADPLQFAQGLGSQIGQSMALAATFDFLKASEQRNRSLMENSSSSIFIVTLEGVITETNHQGEVLLGCKKSDIIGKKLKDFLALAYRNDFCAWMQELETRKSLKLTEIQVDRGDGEIRTVEGTSTMIEVGKEKLVQLIGTDVTERNQHRTQALLNDKLATVGLLAAGIAHEINNPSAWVLSNLDYIKEQIQDLRNSFKKIKSSASPEKIKMLQSEIGEISQKKVFENLAEVVDESMQGTERMKEIVKSLKGFSRVEDEDEIRVNINDILLSAIHMALPEYKYRAKVETDFGNDLPTFYSSSGKLHQVFLNLIINAAQAIPQGDVAAHMIKIKTSYDASGVRVDIRDSGTGIAPTIMPKIFDPFFTTKPVGTGTGLGLFICHEIIVKLGGDIKVSSTPGKGSTFSIILPLLPAKKIAEPRTSAHHEITSRARVLVVDDEPILLKSIQRTLSKQHEVTTLLGGRAAIDYLKKDDHFDVILCDLAMPDVNGVDVYQFLSEKHPGLENHIIFITGTTQGPNTEFIKQKKIPSIEKPFSKNDLLHKINKMVNEQLSAK